MVPEKSKVQKLFEILRLHTTTKEHITAMNIGRKVIFQSQFHLI